MRIQLNAEPETYRVGNATIVYRLVDAGILEDARREADRFKDGSPEHARRLQTTLWGATIVSLDGIVDAKAVAVSAEPSADFVERVRVEAMGQKEELAGEALARVARGEWVYTVVRGFPPTVKAELVKRVNRGFDSFEDAVGNSERPSPSV